MKTENKSKAARHAFFRALYEDAKNRCAPALERMERNMRQYLGSDEIDGSNERALSVRNITYELIESQISSEIPRPKVDPACYSEDRDRAANAVEHLLSALRDRLPYEEINDLDERFTHIYGGSVFIVEWDHAERLGDEIGGVRLHCLSPKAFLPQPNVSSVGDMEYCFLLFSTTRGELSRRYGVSEEETKDAECEFDAGVGDEGDTVRLVLTFYRGEDGEIGEYIFSGDLPLADLPDYYRRKKTVCRACGREKGLCLCEKPRFALSAETEETLNEDLSLSGGRVIPAFLPGEEGGAVTLPYFTPKNFPIVIRKNTSAEDEVFGLSDCEVIRPEQQAINKIESRIQQKLLRAGITPIMPEDASVSLNNTVFGQVIRMKPGESASQYGKVDTTPDVSQDIAEAERLYDHAKRVIGVSDAYQGIDGATNESGVARQLRISQASGRLESKKKMKYTAYANLDRLIFEHYLAFADEPRACSYKDAWGRIHNAEFSRYDFLVYDPKERRYTYDDAYLFSVDLNGGAEYLREALWERNLENLRAGTLGDPNDPITLLRYWQCQERAHYPFARENVEYFTDAIKKGETVYGKDPELARSVSERAQRSEETLV